MSALCCAGSAGNSSPFAYSRSSFHVGSGVELDRADDCDRHLSLAVCIVEALVLRCVAQHDTENLHNFFIAATGIRMLLALLTLTGCYLAEGRDAMLPYCAVFMSFYFVFLIHHSVFFTRVLNSHAKCDKEK